ncbi:hypothetical protein MTR67_035193 [Solanum verrucosum]|uniref:Uncharacterized protein n=1 Tax=Solanum verrucosum TaxID=315347 RepID=A0AAF0ZL88_SOLVR|nr:hypothetical protein MTR67_035193 [Solanum verrucosum]
MDNEIQKLKTNEDNLKSKASQQHDYKNAELRRSEDGKNPELKGDDGKLLKTHNVCLNIAADSMEVFMDDFSIVWDSFEECLHLEMVLQRILEKETAFDFDAAWLKSNFERET